MAGPKRAADDIDIDSDAALETQRRRKEQKTGDATPGAHPEPIASASPQDTELGAVWKANNTDSLTEIRGMWQYTTGEKPTRTWIDRTAEPSLEEETGALNLNQKVFAAETGDKEISDAYQNLWVKGDSQAFIDTIYNQFTAGASHILPTLGFIQVWKCLVGELVPEKIQDQKWPGMPVQIISSLDSLWNVAKCVFQLITRGRFFSTTIDAITTKDGGKDFKDFRKETLEGECGYSQESLDLLLSSLDNDSIKRPTREAILEHCDRVLPKSNGAEAHDQRIPKGLRPEESAIYDQVIQIVDEESGRTIPQIVVVTDINKDVDDLVAMVLLKELHRLGLIVLRGFVANLRPAKCRALAGRGALNALGLHEVPIAVGTEAEVYPSGKEPRVINDYEFELCPFMAPEDTHLEGGAVFLTRLCKDAKEKNEKLTFLLISGLRDMNDFVKEHPTLLQETAEKIVLQGGYRVENKEDGKVELIAAEDAANNHFDIKAAREFHHYMAANDIPSVSYTKVAAFATFIPEQLLIDLEETGHPVGEYLHKSQVLMDVAFYEDSCSPDPEKRFRPFMDQQWYLKFKSSYYQHEHPAGEPLPVGKEVEKYFNKLVAYDALAALAAGGDDILDRLQISRPVEGGKPLHQVIGTPEVKEVKADPEKNIQGVPYKPADEGINGEPMAQAIRALVRGSLLACQQNLPLPSA
ncbi:hypothetical protein LSUE1_G006799 [Lachnellula suecica]|uniref:Inosine/uridine-preferring nucleoside hydrolase domain-containing protein n=1 Tax=Lachnellula suecica TaxID=602035 RepID=A0A8T9BZJ2_9HELO|nr:hypothetical protein LSUE1_G006799 [Lachnellula suecica]